VTGPIPKIELKLNEENELNFKLSIEGTISDSDMSSPVYRFMVTEMGSERGWVFPAKKDSDDIVSVRIPPLKEGFGINKKYHGKLEVIVGPLYFSPSELMMEFTRPMQIEATPILNKSGPTKVFAEPSVPAPTAKLLEKPVAQPVVQQTQKKSLVEVQQQIEEDEDLEEELLSVIGKEKKPMQQEVAKPAPRPLIRQQPPARPAQPVQVKKQQDSPGMRPRPSPAPAKPVMTNEQKKKLFQERLMFLFKSALSDED